MLCLKIKQRAEEDFPPLYSVRECGEFAARSLVTMNRCIAMRAAFVTASISRLPARAIVLAAPWTAATAAFASAALECTALRTARSARLCAACASLIPRAFRRLVRFDLVRLDFPVAISILLLENARPTAPARERLPGTAGGGLILVKYPGRAASPTTVSAPQRAPRTQSRSRPAPRSGCRPARANRASASAGPRPRSPPHAERTIRRRGRPRFHRAEGARSR